MGVGILKEVSCSYFIRQWKTVVFLLAPPITFHPSSLPTQTHCRFLITFLLLLTIFYCLFALYKYVNAERGMVYERVVFLENEKTRAFNNMSACQIHICIYNFPCSIGQRKM